MNEEINMLYVEFTKKCNSRCITCSYWETRTEQRIVQIDTLMQLIQKLPNLKVILFTGGEALLFPEELFELAKAIREIFPDIELRLLTNGIKVGKFIDEICELFNVVVFSFDAANSITYKQIRGIDAFDLVVENVQKIHAKKIKIRFRCMILDNNANELFDIVKLAADLGVNHISFLPVDLSSDNGFGRKKWIKEQYQLQSKEIVIDELSEILNVQEWLQSGLIPNQGKNIKEMISYFQGMLRYQICNAPDTSIVVEMNGDVKGCFFRKAIGNICTESIDFLMNSPRFICEKREGRHRSFLECDNCIL